jgi:hypothetical protein
MARQETTGQNNSLMPANKSSENVAKFKYLRTTVTYKHRIPEGIKSQLNSWNTS